MTPRAHSVGGAFSKASAIATLGDSITCCATGPNTSYPFYLAPLVAPRIVNNVGVSGATTTTILANQWTGLVRGRGYGTAVVMGGVNDIRASTPTATITANLQAMYDQARADGMRLILQTVLPASNNGGWTGAMTTDRNTVNAFIKAYASTNSLPIVDWDLDATVSAGTALAPGCDSGDGLHPNPACEAYMAGVINGKAP